MTWCSVRLLIILVACFCFACGDDDGTERDDSGVRDSGPGMDGAPPDVTTNDAGPCDEGEPCDADGDGCTMDTCRRGRCILGTNSACNDGASCTADECRSTGAMTFECDRRIGPKFCAINATCYREDDPNPMNLCQVCVPGDAPMTWTTLTAECDDQDECTSGDTCETGECIGVPVLDAYEDNSTRGTAARLDGVDDDETFPSGSDVEGTLFPEGDEDWYVYLDTDRTLGLIFPRVDLEGIPEGTNYELCAFVSCTEAGTDGADCAVGTPTTFEGIPGCCSNAAGNLDESVRVDHECSGGDDTVDVFVRVRQVEGPPVCRGGYNLIYGDD
ncbi:MAG: hypothetical protein ACI9KE_000727 [Polyangiales bacterium]